MYLYVYIYIYIVENVFICVYIYTYIIDNVLYVYIDFPNMTISTGIIIINQWVPVGFRGANVYNTSSSMCSKIVE